MEHELLDPTAIDHPEVADLDQVSEQYREHIDGMRQKLIQDRRR